MIIDGLKSKKLNLRNEIMTSVVKPLHRITFVRWNIDQLISEKK